MLEWNRKEEAAGIVRFIRARLSLLVMAFCLGI